MEDFWERREGYGMSCGEMGDEIGQGVVVQTGVYGRCWGCF
jgi:hypothetical protein